MQVMRRMYAHMTVHAVWIHRPSDAPAQIDEAIALAIQHKKPAYIEMACNILHLEVSFPTKRSFNFRSVSDAAALAAALRDASTRFNAAVKLVLVTGSKVRAWRAGKLIETLSQVCVSGYAGCKGVCF
ncbi:MAG: hypothetical protein NXI01_02315 [Gammaproteobacteria bacterium]|nr:hypothetical protein [Gammaproteobacteria bacterium]